MVMNTFSHTQLTQQQGEKTVDLFPEYYLTVCREGRINKQLFASVLLEKKLPTFSRERNLHIINKSTK